MLAMPSSTHALWRMAQVSVSEMESERMESEDRAASPIRRPAREGNEGGRAFSEDSEGLRP
eukprot:200151-Pyramimonas_sp.AAC.1